MIKNMFMLSVGMVAGYVYSKNERSITKTFNNVKNKMMQKSS